MTQTPPSRRNRGSRIDPALVATEMHAAASGALAAWLEANPERFLTVLRRGLGLDPHTGMTKGGQLKRRGQNPQCLTWGPLYDSEGRKYRIDYRVVATAIDGSGPIITSNLPGSFAIDRAYPAAFQARDLSSLAESSKIRKIASGLDPTRVLWTHSDPTLGAPVVWEDKGRDYVLGGNGRTIGILMAPEDRYAAYLAELRDLWGAIVPDADPPRGMRYVLVRSVTAADGRHLPIAEAVKLAGASQESTAAGETPLGRALSVVRGLGITDVGVLPAIDWSEPLNIDNVKDFIRINGAFWNALMERMDPARREVYVQDHKAVEILKQVMVAFLPVSVRSQGFGDEATEETLLSSLPLMVSLETQIIKGNVPAKWSLLQVLPDAISLYRSIEQMPKKDRPGKKEMHVLLEREANQLSIGGGASTLLGNIHLLGFYLGVGLSRWSSLSDPSVGVRDVLKPYYEMALRDHAKQEGMGGMFAPRAAPADMFGASTVDDPASALARLQNLRVPSRLPAGVRRNPRRR